MVWKACKFKPWFLKIHCRNMFILNSSKTTLKMLTEKSCLLSRNRALKSPSFQGVQSAKSTTQWFSIRSFAPSFSVYASKTCVKIKMSYFDLAIFKPSKISFYCVTKFENRHFLKQGSKPFFGLLPLTDIVHKRTDLS